MGSVLDAKPWIGKITRVDYIGRSVAVVQLPDETSGLDHVRVSPLIDLGTDAAPLVKAGQTIRVVRKRDDTYVGIQIDPKEMDFITKLSDLIDYALAISGAHEIRDIWWRGQPRIQDSRGPWTLVPGVYRKRQPREYEITNTSRFMAKARSRHASCPPEYALAEWIFLMQHYGLPTRLLDWTESPLVAAFFAVNDDSGVADDLEADATIWALNPFLLNQCQINEPKIVSAMSVEALPLLKPAFDITAQLTDNILAVTAIEIDPRMLAQLSTFTLHGSSITLEQLHDNATPQFLHKATIPGAARKILRIELERIGIRSSSLFPDLQHLAKELAGKDF